MLPLGPSYALHNMSLGDIALKESMVAKYYNVASSQSLAVINCKKYSIFVLNCTTVGNVYAAHATVVVMRI